MPYLGKSPSQGVRNRYYYTVSASATSVSGSDDNSNTLIFADGEYVDVYLNGVLLVAGTDYNTSTANTIASISSMSANDIVEVIVYDTFSVFSGNVNSNFTVGGDLDVDGVANLDVVDIDGAVDFASTTAHAGNASFADNAKAIFGAGTELEIYSNGSIGYIDTAELVIANAAHSENIAKFIENGEVQLYYDNVEKFNTQDAGVVIHGTIANEGATDFTIDVSQDLCLDSGHGDFYFKDAGTSFLNLYESSDHAYFYNPRGSGDLKFQGNGVSDALTLDMSANGGAIFNDGSLDADFRVEGDSNSHTLFVDASADLVAIKSNGSAQNGVTAQSLSVRGDSAGNTTPVMMISDSDSSVEADSEILHLAFTDDSAFATAIYARFNDQGGAQGSISGEGTGSVAFNTSSDERLKENIVDTESKWDVVKSLQVRDYKWKKSDKVETGFIAQELNEKWSDPVLVGGDDETRSPWSVDYGRLTPLLTKALQEAMKKIEELEIKVATLEG